MGDTAGDGESLDAGALADRIGASMQVLGTAERAAAEQRYLKSDLFHYGTAVPDIRRCAKEFLRSRPALDHDDLIAVVVALWDAPVHEHRMAAIELLTARIRLLSGSDLGLIENMLRESRTWALVDSLAGTVVAAIVAADTAALAVLDRWVDDADFWIRRSAVLGLRRLLRDGEQLDRFFDYADRLLDEREFFIRKVLGWVAREIGQRNPEPVSAWLRRSLQRMNGVTIREATRYLPDADEIVAEWKAQPRRRNSVG